MKTEIRLSGRLYQEIHSDLVRSHPFAAERVGFAFGKIGTFSDGSMVLLHRYQPLPDHFYVSDDSVGARIGRDAMADVMQALHKGRLKQEGAFHVHCHEHSGPPGMSRTDAQGIPPMIPGFQSVSRKAAHGIIIFSRDHGSGWIWLPGRNEPLQADRLTVIGAPIGSFERRNAK